MKRVVLILTSLAALHGCGGCGGGDRVVGKGAGPVTLQSPPPRPDVPPPGNIYQGAFEAARKEITAENVEEHLERIEREIDESR